MNHIGSVWDELRKAAALETVASDGTHPLYRYPGSMSPYLARALISVFSQPGQLVMDPFCGGGTTAVEAISLGRHAWCSDLSSLACFITRAKATPLSPQALHALEEWAEEMCQWVADSPNHLVVPLLLRGGAKYAPRTHGLLLAIRDSTKAIPVKPTRLLAQLIVLRVGQICFHCRSTGPNPRILARTFQEVASQAIGAMQAYSEAYRRKSHQNGLRPHLTVQQADASSLREKLGARSIPISLVVTSPPYPGVHVLYHRWQILGRRETDLPFRLANMQDGRFESEYALGSRQEPGNVAYFDRLRHTYSNLRAMFTRRTIIAQVVGFSNQRLQLEQFRAAMFEAGYEEVKPPNLATEEIKRLVPRRRWYAVISPRQSGSEEFLLVHRPRRTKVSMSRKIGEGGIGDG